MLSLQSIYGEIWTYSVKIRIDHIQDKPLTMRAEEPIASFPLLAEMQNDAECIFITPVRYDLTAVREYDHVRVSGTVGVTFSLVCSRCLAPYESSINSSITIVFRPGTLEETAFEEETELSEQDLISSFYSGDEIDLTHELEEQIALEIPFRPLCDDNCRGLCPECGTDLNHSSCSCSAKQFNFKFSVLKDFKTSR